MWPEIVIALVIVTLLILTAYSEMRRGRGRGDSRVERRQQYLRDRKQAPHSSLRFELPPVTKSDDE